MKMGAPEGWGALFVLGICGCQGKLQVERDWRLGIREGAAQIPGRRFFDLPLDVHVRREGAVQGLTYKFRVPSGSIST